MAIKKAEEIFCNEVRELWEEKKKPKNQNYYRHHFYGH